MVTIRLIWTRYKSVAVFCERGNGPFLVPDKAEYFFTSREAQLPMQKKILILLFFYLQSHF
jgi:hypothetical protein